MRDELQSMNEESLMELERDLSEEAQSEEDILDCLKRTEKGLVKQSIENVVFVLEHDPLLRGAIRKNELTGRRDIVREMPWKRSTVTLVDTDENYIRLYLEKHYQLTSMPAITAGLDICANNNRFHPIRERLEGLRWDGRERISHALHHFLGAADDAYTAEVMKMHMLAAISRIYEPGCKYDIALCLVGPQGGGKSTFFRFLAMDDNWFTDDLRRIDDKRVFEKISGHWIIELSEMSALVTAKCVEEMKSFLSRQREVYRIAYDKYAADHPRQCVFCGTSNDMKFLPFDRSGNRRFAPVEVNPALAEVHPMADEKASRDYIGQMWAEAMVIYRSGDFELTFSKEMEELALEMQKEFMPEDTEIGPVEEYLESHHLAQTCVKEIYCRVYAHMPSEKIPQWASKEITEVFRRLDWKDIGARKFPEYGSQKAWVPPKKEQDPLLPDGFMGVTDDKSIPF